ncbi:23S rRNA (pseudouridine(1915)-N(3))-methyltransferase RlmH [Pelotomaculum isophthalicicum JI]|uniref:Ribosomal RNA large subunit methyltransferase H n=1 Tax=Pelotomaculum isophthalicicum JI TaxID=947010 RepID=A0A9X4H085_9FIRM|nr:23S rRNA (pseudouridine(1915)-N(3))-methyltransferase RlmH [Pelotomaculum isophthalicicum]MDF9407020.1 23S rRNA (pseudouridine(1915)-N(3))-methyltransferase RlmH [Pelotomaculum isophthalicicum JI]
MRHIAILTVGRLKEQYLTAGVGEYLKRLTPYAKVELSQVEDESFPDNPSTAERQKVREKEGMRLLNRLRPGTFLVALDEKGVSRSSEEMAGLLNELALAGRNDLTFVIGGSLGLSPNIIQRSDLLLSFSKLTFPHQLFRLILLEQLYRWFKISRGEPYHH